MEFEWNPLKSVANASKHGVSFEDALGMWTGRVVEVAEIAKTIDGETRGATLGLIAGHVYTAVWTLRGETIRLISVRRARYGETKVYFEKVRQEGGREDL
jgi:uncharacterized DUF497 family protein